MNETILELTQHNFNRRSLDNFIRRQKVTRCWRKVDGEYRLLPVEYVEDWDLNELRQLAARICEGLKNGNIAFGAFIDGEPVGFAYLDRTPFGSKNQYIDLAEFYVSLPHRNKGLGRKLFKSACDGAKRLGAKSLYISAHSAEDSIAAYKSFGCIPAEEINAELAQKEPFDLPLEFKLI